MKRKKMFTKFYVAIFLSYFVVRIMSVFENDFDKDETTGSLINDDVISYFVIILGLVLIIIDCMMISLFYSATSKFIELLMHAKDQKCNRIYVRMVNITVILLIIIKSIGSHILDNGYYLFFLIDEVEEIENTAVYNSFEKYIEYSFLTEMLLDGACVVCQNFLHFLIGCILLLIYYKLGNNKPLMTEVYEEIREWEESSRLNTDNSFIFSRSETKIKGLNASDITL